jgi:hypothetical protein
MLEKLARGRGSLPRNQHYITITVPSGSSYEVVGRDHLPGWDTAEPTVSRAHGGAWAAASSATSSSTRPTVNSRRLPPACMSPCGGTSGCFDLKMPARADRRVIPWAAVGTLR